MILALSLFISLFVGLVLGLLVYRLNQAATLRRAELDAQELIQESKDKLDLQLLDEKERHQELETELWAKEESLFQKLEERIESLQEQADERKQKLDNHYSVERQRALENEREVKSQEEQIQKKEATYQTSKEKMQSLLGSFKEKLAQRLGSDPLQVKEEVANTLIEQARRRSQEQALRLEEEAKEHAESFAKDIIDRALVRFHRPFCPERGIPAVYFEQPDQRKILCDAKGENIKLVQELTGCDVIIEDDMDLIGVAGFDPVRRELTRRVLERLLKEKRPVNTDFIKRCFENIKRELFSQIRGDGDNLAKELKLEGLHPEVRQMMGSLRFRYSFTQNQYFHCGEVGWLCGLLASELGGVSTSKARRSGMLHDLGKSMDHELEGGHAVIGADFIEKRNEAADVVHAVRAHHYDIHPDSDLAYLVIGADAISGGRPGARRSTMESYTQKVTELEAIARSFHGVTDCFILSGGRECRVLVNGRQVDDLKALALGRDISKRIEEECNYPGQIKVVVVRETMAVESTSGR